MKLVRKAKMVLEQPIAWILIIIAGFIIAWIIYVLIKAATERGLAGL